MHKKSTVFACDMFIPRIVDVRSCKFLLPPGLIRLKRFFFLSILPDNVKQYTGDDFCVHNNAVGRWVVDFRVERDPFDVETQRRVVSVEAIFQARSDHRQVHGIRHDLHVIRTLVRGHGHDEPGRMSVALSLIQKRKDASTEWSETGRVPVLRLWFVRQLLEFLLGQQTSVDRSFGIQEQDCLFSYRSEKKKKFTYLH